MIDLYWSPQLRTWPCSPSGPFPFLSHTPGCFCPQQKPAWPSQRSLGFLLYFCIANEFYQQWYPNLRLDLPHKFKVSFPNRCRVCVQSCSGRKDNKSNKFNVFSSLGSAFSISLRARCWWNTLLMLPLQSGVKKEGKRRKRAQGVTWECTAPCWTQHGHRAVKPLCSQTPHTQTRILPQSSSWCQGIWEDKEKKSYSIENVIITNNRIKKPSRTIACLFPSHCPGSCRYSPCPSGCAA